MKSPKKLKMYCYEFTLRLDVDPDLDTIDRLYGYFGANGSAPEGVEDFTLAILAGTPIANCTVKAESFDAALHLLLPGLSQEGLGVVRAEVDEEGLAIFQV